MNPFEVRRKICRAAVIFMIATAFLYCLILCIIVKSTDILANSLEGVKSVEADNLAIQWVFQQSQGFRVWTIIFSVIEILCLCGVVYCLIEGIKPSRDKLFNEEKPENVEDRPVSGESAIEDSTLCGGNNDEQPIEERVIMYISKYSKKYIVPFVFHWLTHNGSLGGATQEEFRKFVEAKTDIKVSPAHMSKELGHISYVLENPDTDAIAKDAYDLMAKYLASFIKINQPFDVKV